VHGQKFEVDSDNAIHNVLLVQFTHTTASELALISSNVYLCYAVCFSVASMNFPREIQMSESSQQPDSKVRRLALKNKSSLMLP
jgi:hypothetical protein